MKLIILLITTLFYLQNLSACECNNPNVALEYLSAKYVFKGKVISKEYSEDKLTYSVILEVLEHYKEGEEPKNLHYKLPVNDGSSCGWEIGLGQTWLIFSTIRNGRDVFSQLCSNSRFLKRPDIEIKRISENWDQFDIDDYIFSDLDGHWTFFTPAYPEKNIDSLIQKYYTKDYSQIEKAPSYRWNRAHILVDIDRKGKVKQVAVYEGSSEQIRYKPDSIFRAQKYHKVKQTRDLLVFEKDMLRAVKKIRSYTPVKIENTEITVPYRQVMQFEKSNDTIYSHYSR